MRSLPVALHRPEYQNGRLCWDNVDLSSVADAHGTPCHVCSAQATAASLESFLSAFREVGLDLEVRFSVKSNPVPVFLDELRLLGAGFETLSTAELDLVHSLGVEGSRIVLSDVSHGEAALARADALGVELVVAATPLQLETALRYAVQIERPLPLGLSINPRLTRARWDLTLSSSGTASSYGFTPGENDFDDAIDLIASTPGARLTGMHMHIGSGIRTSAPYRHSLRVLERAVSQAATKIAPIELIDIGGGFGMPQAPVHGVSGAAATLLGVGTQRRRQATSPLSGVATAVAATVARLDRDGLAPTRLRAEPGRAVSGPCQMLLLTVQDVVERRGRLTALCDGGAMSLSSLFITEAHEVRSLEDRGGERLRYRIQGNLPTAMDAVAAEASLPRLRPGDRVAVLDTGAYFVSTNNTFTGGRPPVVWLRQGRFTLARRAERDAEVFARDLLPAGGGLACRHL